MIEGLVKEICLATVLMAMCLLGKVWVYDNNNNTAVEPFRTNSIGS